MTAAAARAAPPPAFAQGGALGALIANHDWTSSPLGPVERWSIELVHAVQLLLPAQAEIVLFWGPDHVALYNDAYAPTIGNKHPRALGRPARENWSELWDDLEPLLDGVRATGETYSAKDRPFHIDRHDGVEEAFFDLSYSAVRSADGSVGGVLCIVSDTTERVHAARRVAADRERLAQMFDQAPSFIAVLREPGHVYEFVNASYQDLVGHRDLVGKPLAAALPEVADQGFGDLLDTVVETGRPHRGESQRVTLRRGPGGPAEERYVDFIYQPITDDRGRVVSVFVEGSDVTDRWRAEHQLALSETSLRLATDAGGLGTWDLDLTTDTLLWSERTKAMFGISPGVACGMDDFYAGLHPDDYAAVVETFTAAIDPARRIAYDVEYRTVGAEDGVVRWVAARGRGIFDAAGRCTRAVGICGDITARKAGEASLRESEVRFRSLADSAPALIWMTDPDGEVEFANRWFDETLGFGLDELRQRGWLRMLHPDDREHVARARRDTFDRQRGWGGELRVLDKHGRTRWVHAEGRPRLPGGEFAGFIGCAVDVTDQHLAAEALEQGIAERTGELAEANAQLVRQIAEREQVEATLHQMQRLEAIGQLTSGVAHDFNNLLTVVLGNVAMIERAAAAALDERNRQRLSHVRVAAERGAALTAQLLAFSRRQRLAAKPIDLNATVSGMHGMLASTLGATIAIDTRLADGLWPALVDPVQIELIILNLAINARDAMDGAGDLVIETGNITNAAPIGPEDPPAGDLVMVAVCDNGSGMSDAVRQRAFEPFFTTKEVGKGSGLGLAQVFGFAKQSGGGVRIDTAPGQGTTVRVFLPRAMAAPQADVPLATESGGPLTGLVLVVDDDDAVRAVTADTVRQFGCRVVEAASGAAALECLAEVDGIVAVVADFAMPGMNGAEFAAAAAARGFAHPVLFVTGYADLSALGTTPETRILLKPYAAADLQNKLRIALRQ